MLVENIYTLLLILFLTRWGQPRSVDVTADAFLCKKEDVQHGLQRPDSQFNFVKVEK